MQSTGIRVENLSRLANRLKDYAKVAGRSGNPKLVAGYSAEHALAVHEDLEMLHRVGEAKYLTKAVRRHEGVLRDVVRKEMKRGRTLVQALLTMGYTLMRFSKDLVPVDTGELKNSAFVRVERD